MSKEKEIVGAAILNSSEYREKVFKKDRGDDDENIINARTYLRDLVDLIMIGKSPIWVGEVMGGVFFDDGDNFWGFYSGHNFDIAIEDIENSFFNKLEKDFNEGKTIKGFPIDFAIMQINEAMAKYEEVNGVEVPKETLEKWATSFGLKII